MKIIDLLNKIAKGEEVPKKILYVGDNYLWSENDKFYYTCSGFSLYREMFTEGNCLNDEVEIIEEEKEEKEIKELPLEQGDINDKTFLAKYITHNRYKINELTAAIKDIYSILNEHKEDIYDLKEEGK